ncbi:hypothetical protein CAPTEDRAFT_205935 [Capitella teleta]|uniref:Uncharacterized protein n=1 Tax=Capitella teleta TaxID=283909 RepID=R7UF17_CAPTE|nr:hypothetical protein CAPTEDRAFT_205935 [Capitella teleta]|eukprot:ELU02383.1 hypothetical protein CAPTEDRAFT_205935 [Capitella teleta]
MEAPPQRRQRRTEKMTVIFKKRSSAPSLSALNTRALQLGDHAVLASKPTSLCKKPISSSAININGVQEALAFTTPPDEQNVDGSINYLTERLYELARSHPKDRFNESQRRWTRILDTKDSALLWKAIDWKGNFDLRAHSQNDVSDERFRDHFEDLLNPLHLNEFDLSSQATSNVCIPVLDNDIEPIEIAYMSFRTS